MTSGGDVEQSLLGESSRMRELRRLVMKFGPTPLPVLVIGPTGSGKGLVAKALHAASRRSGRFVTANMAALGDGLVESELFGHVRGAFTSSTGSRRGLLQHASGGTAFLDEVHRLSASAQPKLLRVLETRLVRPVGSDDEVLADFRVISAANEDVEALVDAGRFQGDLLARLSRLIIHVPPLVDHLEDVPMMVSHFMREMNGLGALGITSTGMASLLDHDWPRNVRELQAVIERACILADGPWIDQTDVLAALEAGARRSDVADGARTRGPVPLQATLDPVARRERQVLDALAATGNKVRAAAAHLGVSPKTVYRWMGELGIAPPERRRSREVGHEMPAAEQRTA